MQVKHLPKKMLLFRALKTLLFLLLLTALITGPCANAQRGTESNLPQSATQKDEEIKKLKDRVSQLELENGELRQAFSDALDRLEGMNKQLKAAEETVEAARAAKVAAENALAAGKIQREAYEALIANYDKTILAAEKAIEFYQKGVTAYQEAIDAQIKVITALSTALVQAKERESAANKRGWLMSILSFAIGVLLGR